MTGSAMIAFDAMEKFWQLRHDPSAGMIAFETGTDGTTWTSRYTAAIRRRRRSRH